MTSFKEMEMQYQQHFPQQQFQAFNFPLLENENYNIKEAEEEEGAVKNIDEGTIVKGRGSEVEKQPSHLAAVSGNNYADRSLRRATKRRQQKRQNRRHMQPFRPIVGAATNNHGAYMSGVGGGTAQSGPYTGYGPPATGADYNDYHPNQHMPTAGNYHSSSGGGYVEPPPVHPAPYPASPVYHAPSITIHKPSKSRKKDKKGDTALAALTLLSFFFFVNLLQSCLKEHMNTVNPTVMVMSVNGVRNRFNKLAEMNSREQNAAGATAAPTTNNVAVLEAGDLEAAAASLQNVHHITVVQSPYSSSSHLMDANKLVIIENYHNEAEKSNNNKYNNNNNTNLYTNQSTRPEFYDSLHFYGKHNYKYNNNNNNNNNNNKRYTSEGLGYTANVFSTYLRTTSLTLADKSYNYSIHEITNDLPTFQTQKKQQHLHNTYLPSMANTAAPTSYWSLGTDLYQHHTDDYDETDQRT